MKSIGRTGSGLIMLLSVTGLILLAACTSPPPLPTRAIALASVTAAALDTAVVSNPIVVPPTFTPIPTRPFPSTRYDNPPLGPTQAPSATPTLPTRTPTPTATATLAPSATPTEYVSLILNLPPSDELGPSKLGLHVIRNNDPAIMEFVRRAQPAVMKAVDDFGFLAEVRAESPRTITVGRISVFNQDFVGNPEWAARDFVTKHLEIYRLNPAIDYWEGWNEPDPNIDNMTWFARFEAERVRQMANHGFQCAIGGFSTGVPEMDEFILFLPAVEAAKEHEGILSLHEYSAPDMTFLYGSALPGFPAYSDRGALTFRYRWYYREILENKDLVIPLVISEAGIDGGIGNRPGPSGTGWWDFQTYWEEQGLGKTGVEAFINQLAWYDAGVRQDGYVIGFTIFTAGGIGHWEEYDINPILPQLADYAVGQR